VGFFFTVLYTILSYLRPWELYPELAPYRIMLVLGVICGVAVVWDTLAGATDWLRAPQTWLMAAFVAWLGISVALTGWIGGALFAWSDFSTTALVFLFMAVTITSLKRLKIIAIAIVLCTLVLAIQGIAAYHLGYRDDALIVSENVGGDDVPGDTAEVRRIHSVGFLNDPNDFAQTLLATLPLVMVRWRRGSVTTNLFLVSIPAGILLYATYLTFSRGALVALAVMVLMIVRDRWGVAATSVRAAGMAALALVAKIGGRGFSTSEESAASRIDAWSTGMDLLRHHPLSGIGYNHFQDYYALTAHNAYVLCFAELGIIGYFLWLALIVLSTLQLTRIISGSGSRDDDSTRWAGAIQKSFFAFLASSFFLSRTYIEPLYILLGMIAAFYGFTHKQGIITAQPVWSWTWRTAATGFSSIVCIYGFIVATHLLGK
jgi:putative inorganic carbon (HCO3(-)) transporter